MRKQYHCQLCHTTYDEPSNVTDVTIRIGDLPALTLDLCYRCGTEAASLYMQMVEVEVARATARKGLLN